MSRATKRVQLLGNAQAVCGARNRERSNENTRKLGRRTDHSFRTSAAPVDRASTRLRSASRFDWNRFINVALKLTKSAENWNWPIEIGTGKS
jgi:hypothetical protein